ncbi:MAG: DUF6088 family protein [Porphyromonadaceae bacterium]|nr:DUF6088 family protein [Porphyromonadaceae bacterium]
MVIREDIKRKISALSEGLVVSASDFDIPRRYRATLVKALNQFEYAGVLKRVSKGRYYKPQKSYFGEQFPSEREIVKDFLEKGNKVVGYITGTRAFSSLALTTQVSSTIMVGTNVSRRPVNRGQYRIVFLLQPNLIVKEDIPLFILLDALRLIKKIPATTPGETILQIMAWVKELSDADRNRLIELGKAYKPYVKAQLGAIFEYLGYPFYDLQEMLNPVSHYRLGITSAVLPTSSHWNII